MGIHSLAIVYTDKRSQYYNQEYIKDIISFGIEFLAKIQKKDGSFDEWYVNERGWAGPTGYIIHSCCRTLELMGSDLTSDVSKVLITIIKKGSDHLCSSYEKQVITNHLAISLTALFGANEILNESRIDKHYRKIKKEILDNHTEEGWSLEYDGPDTGYQSATISFLSHIHKKNMDEEIKSIALSSLGFIEKLTLPNGSLCNALGSRHTSTQFFLAYEYWKKISPIASRISELIKLHGATPLLHEHEDHYYIYRLTEMLEAAYIEDDACSNYLLSSERNTVFEEKLNLCGIEIYNNNNRYLTLNTHKGGVIQGWDKKDKQEFKDCGLLVKSTRGEIYTSDSNEDHYEVKNLDNQITISGYLKKIPIKYFNPYSFIAFRSFMLIFGVNPKLASFIKGIIKSVLITPSRKSTIRFSRTLSVEKENLTVHVENQLTGMFKGYCVYSNGFFYTRYVPQSRYFVKSDFRNRVKEIKQVSTSDQYTNRYIV